MNDISCLQKVPDILYDVFGKFIKGIEDHGRSAIACRLLKKKSMHYYSKQGWRMLHFILFMICILTSAKKKYKAKKKGGSKKVFMMISRNSANVSYFFCFKRIVCVWGRPGYQVKL